MSIAEEVLKETRSFSNRVNRLKFGEPVTHVYNPLSYAWKSHSNYIQEYGASQKKVLFLGMNPGPWGMSQTGVPFGEVTLVRDWMKVDARVQKPKVEHPKRPIEGFDCEKSEVSGRRLWGFFKDQYGTAKRFFRDHYVINYCPLVFMELSGKNRTPDKLPRQESSKLFELCDEHLIKIVKIYQPEWLVGVGAFARKRAERVLIGTELKFGTVLHPSPASPLANKDWPGQALKQLKNQKIWN